MKVIAVFLLAALGLAASAPKNSDGYSTDEVLNNPRLLLPYIKCVLDQGKCTPAAKEFRSNIAESLETDCAKCTEDQKKDNRLIFKHLINKEKEWWPQLVAKYDPQRKYAPKYEEMFLGKE